MVKTLKYIGLFAVVLAMGLASCKKGFLELTPTTSLTPEQALASEADLAVALRGAYAGLRNVDMYGRTVPLIGDVMADNAYQHSINTNRYTLFNNYTFNATDANALGLWSAAYTVILRTNNIINADVPSSANVDQYKGEAYAIRALSYFTLIRYFARPYTDNPDALGVPIVLQYNADLKPPRNKVSEVYALILDDLNKAYTMMTKFVNSSQFSKYAAKGLQAKVYLTMGDKANAKTAALDVINNSGWEPLTVADHDAYWANGGLSIPTSTSRKLETLFEVSSDATANLAFDALSYIYSQNGNYGDFVVADDLYASFTPGDVRLNLYPIVPRPKSPPGPAIATVNKYPVINGDVSDTKVLRLSEMYLIAAEASLPGNEADALMYVNFIRSRRGAPDITSTGAQLFEDIIEERRRELAFEGDRYMDLMRLKRDVTRSANYPSSARTIPYSNFRRILPIPQSELDANPAIRPQQNTGY
ncbi:MAG TPA: RagB/SusD family nutrient uptake outer membrane protein [Chitinophagaceae bacterium]|nr:RagB/SusD family nutrient uptake outer membrane protein [Chitinophagaceae bacterium]